MYYLLSMGLLVCGAIFYFYRKPEDRLFFKQSFQKKSLVGSLYPSSKYMAGLFSNPLAQDQRQQRNILEIGAGTGGNITEALIRNLKEKDHLDLVEVEPAFCKVLEEKYGHLSNVSVHCISITEFNPGYLYDFLITTLPHTLFPPDFLQKVLYSYECLMAPAGVFSVAFYPGFNLERSHERWIHNYILRNQINLENVRLSKAMLDTFYQKYPKKIEGTWLNLPPVYAYHLTIDCAKEQGPSPI